MLNSAGGLHSVHYFTLFLYTSADVAEWQTQTTQNRSGNRVGSTPIIGSVGLCIKQRPERTCIELGPLVRARCYFSHPIKSILSLEYPHRLIKKSLFFRTFNLTAWVTVPPHWLSSGVWGAPHSPTPCTPRFLICIEPAPAHEEASNFCLSENSITKIRQKKYFRKTALLVLADKALLWNQHCQCLQSGHISKINIAIFFLCPRGNP